LQSPKSIERSQLSGRKEQHHIFAVDANGDPVHVSDVPNGQKCGAFCHMPDCNGALEACQGKIVRPYFRHQASTNCSPSRESQLHLFAKKILAKRRELKIPSHAAQAAGVVEQVVSETIYKFDKVTLEKTVGEIRPDVILESAGGRRLLVEVYVRHKTGAEKCAKIANANLDAIEIDLSAISWDDGPETWIEPILYSAPRTWLHSTKAAKRELALTKELEAEASEIVKTIKSKLKATTEVDPQAKSSHDSILEAGYGSFINPEIGGDDYFLVPTRYWQLEILGRFFWNARVIDHPYFTTTDAVNAVKHCVPKRLLGRMSNALETQIRDEIPEFLPPWKIVVEYLKWLKKYHHLLSHNHEGKGWRVSSTANQKYRGEKARFAAIREWRKEMSEWLRPILLKLPGLECFGFDLGDWFDQFEETYDDDEIFTKMQAIYKMVMEDGPLVYDYLGLPLEGEAKRVDQRQKEKAATEKVQRQKAAIEFATAARLKRIKEAVGTSEIGEPSGWLAMRFNDLDGFTLSALAEQSDEGLARSLAKVRELLELKRAAVRVADAKIRADQAKQLYVGKLATEAEKRIKDPARRRLWLNSGQPKLNGARPVDYCDDSYKLQKCIGLLPK
jgi:hypothetical protein